MTPRQQRIEQLLNELQPSYLEVLDESHNHHVPENAQTHFKVTIVSPQFNGLRLLNRHQMINEIVSEEFKSGMHALSIHAYTDEEWQKRQQQSPRSPACRDGYAK